MFAKGSCNYGDRCRFLHDKGGPKGPPAGRQNEAEQVQENQQYEQQQESAPPEVPAEEVDAAMAGGKKKVVPFARSAGKMGVIEETDDEDDDMGAEEIAKVARAGADRVRSFNEVSTRTVPRPKVRPNQKMFVWIAGRRQKAIKDTGACCSTMPESLALDLVNIAIGNPTDTPPGRHS